VQLVKKYKVTGAEVLAVSFGIGSLFASPVVATTSSWISKPSDVFLVVYLGLATTALAYIFFGNGISHLSPGTVSTMTLAEPLLATFWGVFLLSEPMSVRGWFGAAIILVALLYLGLVESRNPHGEELGEVVINA
jgi:DME family drug/metabolite transporter